MKLFEVRKRLVAAQTSKPCVLEGYSLGVQATDCDILLGPRTRGRLPLSSLKDEIEGYGLDFGTRLLVKPINISSGVVDLIPVDVPRRERPRGDVIVDASNIILGFGEEEEGVGMAYALISELDLAGWRCAFVADANLEYKLKSPEAKLMLHCLRRDPRFRDFRFSPADSLILEMSVAGVGSRIQADDKCVEDQEIAILTNDNNMRKDWGWLNFLPRKWELRLKNFDMDRNWLYVRELEVRVKRRYRLFDWLVEGGN